MYKLFQTGIFFLIFSFMTTLFAQNQAFGKYDLESNFDENGRPFIQNYDFRKYDAHPQNWQIVQDKRGVMYFGNTSGVLEYDGVSWRLIQMPNQSIVRSLGIDESGRIYVGAVGDLGYLAPDSTGKLQVVSLKKYLKPEDREFEAVWKLYTTKEGVYFQTWNRLFRWANNQFKVWKPKHSFHLSFLIEDTLYIRQREIGLMKLVGDSLQLVPDGAKFAYKRIYVMLPYPPKKSSIETKESDSQANRILIGTRTQGLFLYDKKSVVSFPTEIDNFLLANQLYYGVCLPDELIALTTLRGGVVIIDKAGKSKFRLNETIGLQNNKVLFAYMDAQQGLWLSLNSGITRVEIHSPFSIYDEFLGLKGTVNEGLHRHQGRLYAGTSLGAFVLKPASANKKQSEFEALPGIEKDCWSFLTTGNSLILATDDGVFQLKNNSIALLNRYNAFYLYASKHDPNRIFVGLFDGLASLRYHDGTWVDEGKIKGIGEGIRSIVETPEGKLWLGRRSQGALRIKFQTGSPDSTTNFYLKRPQIERYGTNDGLPNGWLSMFNVAGKMRFVIEKNRVYGFDERKMKFYPDSSLGEMLGISSDWIIPWSNEDENGAFWFSKYSESDESRPNGIAYRQADGTYGIKYININRVNRVVWKFAYPDKDNIVWFGGTDGLVRMDLDYKLNNEADFAALIRRVILNPKEAGGDSVIFSGTPSPTSFQWQERESQIISYANNTLRFEFAAPSYDNESANEFSYLLEGFDTDWSSWTKENRKDYTNLLEGDYTFHIRAKNVYGHQSIEELFSFKVLPPWQRTWWAYLIYLALAAFGIYGIVKLRNSKLEKKARDLEKIVVERTKQVAEQAERLKEMDQLKSRFFANISHEFRTPLTLIVGPLEKFLSKNNDETGNETRQPFFSRSVTKQFEVMLRNARRLLRLINQLLDLSKLEAGRLTLQVRKSNIVQHLRQVVFLFSSLAERKRISLQFEAVIDVIEVYYDRDKLEKVIVNLLSNAFKFTPEGGKVEVEVGYPPQSPLIKVGSNTPPLNKGRLGGVEIRISDTGAGIPADHLEHIFDRFYMADSSRTREQEGSGIGLALAKELVELHHGSIRVSSEVDKGTRFVIQLPLGKDHLKKNEISEAVPETETRDKLKDDSALSTEIWKTMAVETSVAPSEKSILDNQLPIVLVVEDNDDVRAYIRDNLTDTYSIAEAGDGEAGFEKAVEIVPDLIISDVMMPKMDGFELCEKLKTDERTSHIPVILLTAKAADKDKLVGLETGADDYLTKPFNHDELLARVKNLIEQRRKLRERFSREVTLQPKQIAITSMDEVFLQRMMDVLEEHLDDEDFTVEHLVIEMGMSRTQLHRKLRALVDQSASQFIRTFRLHRAMEMLKNNAGTASEIAYLVGFSSLTYFTKCFREQFGLTPGEARKKNI